MARKLAKTSSSNIPSEIIEIILSKLSSVKSLLRFKTVSKSWNIIISDPLFIQNHLHSSNSSPNNNLFLSKYPNSTDRGFPLVKFERGKFHAGGIFEENIPNGYNLILRECNGVLLLARRLSGWNKFDKYALWNPSTRWQRYIETPYDFSEYYVVDHGICYDKIAGDFKVVFIFVTKYAIYSCNNDSWTEKKLGAKCHDIGFTDSGIFVDGAIYWILGVQSTNISGRQLLYFDPRTDEIKRLQKPEQLRSLCLYCYKYNKEEKSFNIWIKEKGIDVAENNVVIKEQSIRFVCYSPTDDKTVKEFEVFAVHCGRYIPYRNSLYFPAGVKTKTIKA
ncbi:hypothetical protein MIMGU_mgv1a009710mg [Erythranthe guttata]|uniref:F-box domain-containing protein n=1 Tax=Erythranthe guttata TaxID=4155 RepID=A0A022PWF0_ERYGU|nr:hypothetical protein MIMGU_mgv1a009710mg [Erythranthe guttata]